VSDRGDLSENESDNSNGESSSRISYLNGAMSILSHNLVDGTCFHLLLCAPFLLFFLK
jgi:hypothetical protein